MNTRMPVNKKEEFVYTVFMVVFMALIMLSYNVILRNGLSMESIKIAWLGFPLTFVVAFLIEWFIVGKFGMALAFKILKEDDPVFKKILIIPLLIVSGMVTFMSLYGAVLTVGFSAELPREWLNNMGLNFIVAYPLQVLIARPVVSFIFRKVFPVGTITVPVRL